MPTTSHKSAYREPHARVEDKDVPAIESQEVRYREADAPGNGKHLTVEAGTMERDRQKGNLGMREIPNFGPCKSAAPTCNALPFNLSGKTVMAKTARGPGARDLHDQVLPKKGGR
jgi:hypothetical protein